MKKRQHPKDPNLFWCPKCQTYKARGEFGKNISNIWGIQSICHSCRHKPRKIYQCEDCGKNIIVKPHGTRTKYCHICAATHKKISSAKYSKKIAENLTDKYVKHVMVLTGCNVFNNQAINEVRDRIVNKRGYRSIPQKARSRIMLWDQYIKKQLLQQGLQITPKNIELKREQIILSRNIKQLRRISDGFINKECS